MQEKAQDRQAQMDEVKAKRAYEESEKLCRQKEADDRRKLEKSKQHLEEARKKQFSDKDTMLTQAAKKERDLFLKQCAEIKAAEDAEREQIEHKKRVLLNHKVALNAQMTKNEVQRKLEEAAMKDEGRKLREELEDVRQNILLIKDDKLRYLDQLQIAEKFKVELQTKKVSF